MGAVGRTSQAGRVLVALGLAVYVIEAFRYIFAMSVVDGEQRWFLDWLTEELESEEGALLMSFWARLDSIWL